MSWNIFTDDWRLKLLALGLAVLMLGAVAFSQNPPNYKDLLNVQIIYNIAPDGPIVVVNPPTTAKVRVTALADVLQSVTPLSVAAIFDLTKASVGPQQRVNLSVKAVDTRVTVQNPVVPYSLNIEKRVALKLEVHPRAPRVAPGWKLLQTRAQCPGADAAAVCQANFTGPESYQKNLQAYVDYTTEVAGSFTVPNLPVILEQSGQRFDLAAHRTVPDMTLDPLSVNMLIDAASVIQTRQMTLIDAQPAHGPAPGYRVTNVTVSPITVVVRGSPEALARITATTITLPQIDLGGRTSDYTATVQITYPDGTDGPVKNAKVTYSIAPNPNASP
jgi:YbbR domain-containing protein